MSVGGRAILLCVLTLAMTGCARQRGEELNRVAPAYAELRDSANARSERLERLWARATVVVWSVVDGQESKDQGDGVLQIVRPKNLTLSLGKSDLRYIFFLGSDEDRYWWVDTLDADRRVALVGSHERATPQRARQFGVPVHPLDLIELLGISGLPEQGPAPVWDEELEGWSVTAPARFGQRRIVFDAIERLPIGVTLLDREGQVAAEARLEDYKRLTEFDGEGLRPEMASRITIEMPGIDSRVLIDLGAVKSIDRLPRAIAFDLDGLLRRERVSDVRDLDEQGS